MDGVAKYKVTFDLDTFRYRASVTFEQEIPPDHVIQDAFKERGFEVTVVRKTTT